MILQNLRIPETQNQYQTFKMIIPPPLLCYYKSTSTNTEKCGRASSYRPPYGVAAKTTNNRPRRGPPTEPNTVNLGTCKIPTLPTAATHTLHPKIMLSTETYRLTEASRAWRPDSGMQPRENRRETTQPCSRDAPQLPAYYHPCLKEKMSIQPASTYCA